MSNNNKPARPPLGKAIRWSKADLERLSAIDKVDIAAAGELWRQNAPQRFKQFLEAKLIKDDGNIQK